jgi:DNA invertase Pin-like site-specific DNA recombinase
MGALAEFEHDLIRERTNAGLAAARARGRIGGRPRKLKTTGKVVLARQMFVRRLDLPRNVVSVGERDRITHKIIKNPLMEFQNFHLDMLNLLLHL